MASLSNVSTAASSVHNSTSAGASLMDTESRSNSPDLENKYIQTFVGDNNQDETNNNQEFNTPISRRSSMIERVQSRYSFFNEKLKEKRVKLLLRFCSVYLMLGIFILGVFSIYWGSMYKRNTRLKNLRMLVVIEDDHTIDGIEPLIGNTIRDILDTEKARYYGSWDVFNSTEFAEVADKHDNNVEQELERQIHHQDYWSSIYIKPNASYNFYNAILTGNSAYNVSNNSIVSVYETGRDFLNMRSYVVPSIQAIERMWLANSPEITSSLIGNLPNKSEVLSNSNSLKLITTPVEFTYLDRIPWTDPVLAAPLQVGLIYMIIITFFQVNFFSEIHRDAATYKLKKFHYVAYRIFASVLSFFVIGLFISLVSLAMQVDFQKTFGHSGFLVYWMVTFLTLWAVGSVNEIMAMILFSIFPPLFGFWLLFWVVISIAPTFAPMALTPKFYRYGYALPVHNCYELNKVIFFNTYKGDMGRNFGVLIAWIVITTCAFPFVLKFSTGRIVKKAKAAAAGKAAS